MNLGVLFDVDKLIKEKESIEKETQDPNFWTNQENKLKIKELSSIKNKLNEFKKLEDLISDINEGIQLLKLENDEEVENNLKELLKEIDKAIEKVEISTLLNGKYDINNAIITIHPGAGGTEAMDWAEMLYRMYTRWANAKYLEVREIDYEPGEEAGLKSVTFMVIGEFAYGYLKSEMGVHRLVRISPFDSGGRRHTSFASLEVLPEITEDLNIEINPEDIKMDVFRSSGAGGQHVNKTSSAVRLTHIPTGIVVSCQEQRSQVMNRETCMMMLKSKLLALKEKENKEKIDDLKGIQLDIAWGSQIRSYVFCPYTMVKDHRTNYEVGNVESVMDGNLNDFIDAYLRMKK